MSLEAIVNKNNITVRKTFASYYGKKDAEWFSNGI